jgi:hypothetical protein
VLCVANNSDASDSADDDDHGGSRGGHYHAHFRTVCGGSLGSGEPGEQAQEAEAQEALKAVPASLVKRTRLSLEQKMILFMQTHNEPGSGFIKHGAVSEAGKQEVERLIDTYCTGSSDPLHTKLNIHLRNKYGADLESEHVRCMWYE